MSKIDCHDFATFDKVAKSRNDGVICHTERSEVSLKNIDCHDSSLFDKSLESRNDSKNLPYLSASKSIQKKHILQITHICILM